MLHNLKKTRIDLGLTQMELARQSGISLPTIQNIEADKANPSLEILTKILNVLGLEIKIATPKFRVERAVLLGVPLSTKETDGLLNPSKELLLNEARKWAHHFREGIFTDRESLAITSLLCGLKDEWPSVYASIESPLFERQIESSRNDGHLIKLRRIAISNLARYL